MLNDNTISSVIEYKGRKFTNILFFGLKEIMLDGSLRSVSSCERLSILRELQEEESE